jgi:hypothetical protein
VPSGREQQSRGVNPKSVPLSRRGNMLAEGEAPTDLTDVESLRAAVTKLRTFASKAKTIIEARNKQIAELEIALRAKDKATGATRTLSAQVCVCSSTVASGTPLHAQVERATARLESEFRRYRVNAESLLRQRDEELTSLRRVQDLPLASPEEAVGAEEEVMGLPLGGFSEEEAPQEPVLSGTSSPSPKNESSALASVRSDLAATKAELQQLQEQYTSYRRRAMDSIATAKELQIKAEEEVERLQLDLSRQRSRAEAMQTELRAREAELRELTMQARVEDATVRAEAVEEKHAVAVLSARATAAASVSEEESLGVARARLGYLRNAILSLLSTPPSHAAVRRQLETALVEMLGASKQEKERIDKAREEASGFGGLVASSLSIFG